MLVGVLISIMISIVVGVNLVPTILTSINTAKAQATAIGGFAGLAGLMEVLAYVYGRNVALQSNLHRRTSQIRGRLNWVFQHANPELNPLFSGKCVETRGFAPLGVMG